MTFRMWPHDFFLTLLKKRFKIKTSYLCKVLSWGIFTKLPWPFDLHLICIMTLILFERKNIHLDITLKLLEIWYISNLVCELLGWSTFNVWPWPWPYFLKLPLDWQTLEEFKAQNMTLILSLLWVRAYNSTLRFTMLLLTLCIQ